MARTMVANLTGARLREVDQALRDARGAAAVDALMNAHPHEAKILQHLFDERRAGRPGPALGRIARVMIWSDGAMEFRLVDIPTTGGALQRAVENAPMTVGGRQGLVSRGSSRGPRSGEFVGGRRAGGTGRPERGTGWTQGEPNGAGNRGEGASRPQRGVQPGDGAPRLRTAWFGGARLDPAPRQFRRRPGDDDDVNWGDAPRAGEGWSVVRPGDVLPMDPGDPPEYDTFAEASADLDTAESIAIGATDSAVEHHAISSVGEVSDLVSVAVDEAASASSNPLATRVVVDNDLVPDSHAVNNDHGPAHGYLTTDSDVLSLVAAESGRDATASGSEPGGSVASAEASGHHPASHAADGGSGITEAVGAAATGSATDGADARPDARATEALRGEGDIPESVRS